MFSSLRRTICFISFPATKEKDGTHRVIAFPVNAETRNMIEQAVLAEYEKVVAESTTAK
jgi:DNA-binding cell septation regulator SpoVG